MLGFILILDRTGIPIFPISLTSLFWSFKILNNKFAVVDFPFVPVIVIFKFFGLFR